MRSWDRLALDSVVVVILFVAPQSAQAWDLKLRTLIAPANAGYVGIYQPDPSISPSTRDSLGYQVLVPGFSKVRADRSVGWFPAIDAGVVLWLDADDDEENSMGLGLGGHIVTYKIQDETRFSPALTLNFGSRTRQMFFGVLFTQAGEVKLPGNASVADVPIGHEHDFDSPRGGSAGTVNFYAGVMIGALNAKDE